MSGFERLLIGRVVGDHYRIDGVLGDGGFGVVFRATDLRPDRAARAVAVKVVKVPVGATREEAAQLRMRFRREASYAARLPSHPGLVPIYDYGTDAALDCDFFVMELLRGEDLRTRLSRPDPLPLELALRIVRDAARAVAVGHGAGLVHRDIKPGNVFLAECDDGPDPQVRVLDFGIAKPLAHDDAAETSTHLTRDGRAPLSGRYAAPEQLRAERELTRAVDVFALGVVGFEVLTRTRLFTDADQARREMGLPVPAPSLRARNADVPAGVEEVLHRALAHDPRERFGDAAELARALQQACARAAIVLDGAPAAPRSAWGAAPEEDATRAATEEGTPPFEPTDEEETTDAALERRAAPVPERRRRSLPARAAAAVVGIGIVAMGGSMVAQLAGGAASPQSAVAEVRLTPAGEALAANDAGLHAFRAGSHDEALRHFRRAAELNPGHPEYRNNVGYALLRMGRGDAAVGVLEEVVAAHPDRYVAYGNLAGAYLLAGDTAQAVATLEHLLSLEPPRGVRADAERVLARVRARPAEKGMPESWPSDEP